MSTPRSYWPIRFLALTTAAWAATIALLSCTQAPSPTATLVTTPVAYPGYAQFQRMSEELRSGETYRSGALAVNWANDSKGFDYTWDGKTWHFDVASMKATATGDAPDAGARGGRGARGFGGRGGRGGVATSQAVGRGVASQPAGRGGRGGAGMIGGGGSIPSGGIARMQTDRATSPDRAHNAYARDNNLYLSDADGGNEIAVTGDGSTKTRIRNGTATIIYGEELGMAAGMWWSPDSTKLAYYRFDEANVKDYTVVRQQSGLYDSLEIDAYPKAGTSSPPVDLYVFDLNTSLIQQIDVRDGKPFVDSTLGYYVYRIVWSPDGKELLFSRMNRRQNTVEFCAANIQTGKCRVIVHDEYLPNWVDWVPGIEYLRDRNRFIWTSERNGFKNYYLYDLSGKLIATLTHHNFEAAGLVKIDEQGDAPGGGRLYYMARDGDNHMKLQLHRVNLDGSGDVRLTDPAYNHTVTLSPDNKYFIDVIQTHDMAPATRLVDAGGKVIADLAQSDLTRFDQLGLKRVELFTFKTFDGTAQLHGLLNFPSNFDPHKKYPLLVNVYGGPSTNAARETFAAPVQLTEYGFLVASFDSRSLSGRGRKFSDPFYTHMGIIEMDDQAAGVAALDKRPYVDAHRVGVFGTSYGGTSAATLILRYPDLFQAASSSSPVTDYRNYNIVYPERYEGLVSDNKAGYDAATVMTYANNLKGKLLIYYGTADNNVHNSNAMQLIQALQRAGKSFEVQVGPDLGHTGVNQGRMMEFFIDNLVLRNP